MGTTPQTRREDYGLVHLRKFGKVRELHPQKFGKRGKIKLQKVKRLRGSNQKLKIKGGGEGGSLTLKVRGSETIKNHQKFTGNRIRKKLG